MQSQARTLTLVDAVIPGTGVLRDAVLIVGFALFTAVAAQLSFSPPSWYGSLFAAVGIPIQGTPVPITGQTLAVSITGAALGGRRGMISILLYMLAGMAGLPVYAGSVSKVFSGEVAFGHTGGSIWGPTQLWAIPSGGYIVGFVVAAFVIGWLAARRWDRNPWKIALALLTGNVLIYLFGLPWLYLVLVQNPSLNMDLAKTLNFGLWPFIPGDILKLILATLTLPGAWALVRKFKGDKG